MKKILLTTTALLLAMCIQAKKVKFSLDFGTDSVSVKGPYIIGDFQTYLGQSNWNDYDTITFINKLQQEGTSSIYSLVVDIPAFQKYEYLFVNADGGYNIELPPLESQVQLGFLTNRFIFIDSTANDTTYLPAVRYAGNAPIGKQLLRFKVDMQNQTISNDGVYLSYKELPSTVFAPVRMCQLGNVYHHIIYVDTGVAAIEYDFLNGKTIANKEIKDATCTNANASRFISFSADKEIDTVCYAQCVKCTPTVIGNQIKNTANYIAPNPGYAGTTLHTSYTNYSIAIFNAIGQTIYEQKNCTSSVASLPAMPANGIYSVVIKSDNQQTSTIKYIQQ